MSLCRVWTNPAFYFELVACCLMEFLTPASVVTPQRRHTTPWVHSLSTLSLYMPSRTYNGFGIDPTNHTYRLQSSPNLVPTPVNDKSFY